MNGRTKLQEKIGGPAKALNHRSLVAAARKNLEAITPQMEEALEHQRRRLCAAQNSPDPNFQDVFAAAHQIRSLAGTIGRRSVGKIADFLAAYISDCADCSIEVVCVLARAIERAFDLREGDAVLEETLRMSERLVRAKMQIQGDRISLKSL